MWVLGLLIVVAPIAIVHGLYTGLTTGPPEMWLFLGWFVLIGVVAAILSKSLQSDGWINSWYMSRPMTKRQARRMILQNFRKGERDFTNLLRKAGRERRAKALHPWIAAAAIISGAVSTYMFFFELDLRVWATSVAIAVVNLVLLALVRRHLPPKEESHE